MKGENPMKDGESYEGGRIIWRERIQWRRGNPMNRMKKGESYEGGGILWRRENPMKEGGSYGGR